MVSTTTNEARRLEVRDLCVEVRNTIDIYDLFSELIGGALSGQAFSNMRQARCPYSDHEDRNPSFTLYSDTQKFFCFGCERSGDAVNLARDFGYPNLSIADVARRLLNKVGFKSSGVSRPKPKVSGEIPNKNVAPVDFEIIGKAQAHYANTLFSSAGREAMSYLSDRGVSRKTARRLGLGFGDGTLEAALANAGVNLWRAVKVGLLSKKGDERFANRVILPERDKLGRYIWMIGRAISDDMPRFQALPGIRPFYGAAALDRGLSDLVVVEGVFDYLLLRSWGYSAFGLGGGVLVERAAAAIEALAPSSVAVALDTDVEGRKLSEALSLRLGESASEISLPSEVNDISDLAGYANGRRVFNQLLIGKG